jgi:hypothetical protein
MPPLSRRAALTLPLAAAAAPARRPELITAYYFRAHMYTLVPRHVRDDMQWMKDTGCNALSIALLEQDLFAAVENIEIVANEASKRGLQLLATPSRWAGLTAGAPKVPSLFSAKHPETWMLSEDGQPAPSPRVSGVLSSVHHPLTYQFFCESLDQAFNKFPVAGIIWDEPKAFRPDFSKFARQNLGPNPSRDAHWKAAAAFFSRVNAHIRANYPRKHISMFTQAHNNLVQTEIAAQIKDLDFFGCDGRPWDAETDKQWAPKPGDEDSESGKGKVLLGRGEKILDLARKYGRKTLFLAENHNLPAKMIPAMEAGLPKALALHPDHLLFYYYPRNIEDPDRNMAVVAAALKNYLR